ncbi:Gfo/Idh/MocA family oxidoreductase [Gymnodinialimonas sp. 57CJ19]|uniref:Gfo/Idh/MocA family protein n=1 Tax=Gymnodinialimonas sp. 57CJ19 TaxID=3138498 RepID=UPI0031343F45
MPDIGYGIVGTGYFGVALGRAFHALPNARVVSVYDPENAAPLAAEVGACQESSVEALCARDDIDAVVVASPNWAHAEPVIAAARNGKHIFCEKPIALSYGDCSKMLAAANDAGRIFMAGHVTQFMNGVRHAKALIADGTLGDILYCRAVRTGWEDVQTEVSWKKKRDLSGGHLYHHIHELDLVQSIMGPATEAFMAGGNVAHKGPQFGDEDDLLLITLGFGNDRFATLEYGSAFRWPEHSVLIQGTKGAIFIDLQKAGVELKTVDRQERFLLHRSQEEDDDRSKIYAGNKTSGPIVYGNPSSEAPLWLQGIVEMEVEYFHGLMLGEPISEEFSGLTDGSAAAAAIATADALSLSIKEGRKVGVSEITGQ